MQAQPTKTNASPEKAHDTVIVGGGQAGLAAGYFLARQNADFIILDDNSRTGDSWRKRWDSLRLFTPSQLDGLPGMPYPGAQDYFPTKDEVASYLQGYGQRFELPVRHAVKVDRITREDGLYRLFADTETFSTHNVIVATGPYRVPRVPAFASEVDKSIAQLHSSAYCSPSQIRGQNVLVVGAGNSGAEIALELSGARRHVWLAGRNVGVLPITNPVVRAFGGRPAWWVMRHILSVSTPIGRKAKQQVIHHGHPLGRARREELRRAGVEMEGRVAGMQTGRPRLDDGQVLPVDTIIWATGYRPDLRWIELPILDEDGLPRHQRGVVPDAPGLYFVGLPFQTSINSSLLGGVGADAQYIARQVAQRTFVR